MKYGIIVSGSVTEPVTIPDPLPSWASDATGFLEKMFPGKSGWVQVCEDAVPGTIANEDGTFTNPAEPLNQEAPKSNMEVILERLDAIEAKLDGVI